MNAFEIYNGSNGKATIALYEALQKLGPIGVMAMNLFRAQKCSSRAKGYSRKYRGTAYEKKQWSLGLLCQCLQEHGGPLGVVWGWKTDKSESYCPWVLYVDLPGFKGDGQVSFHSPVRGIGPDYEWEWDGSGNSAGRIVTFTQRVFDQTISAATTAAEQQQTES